MKSRRLRGRRGIFLMEVMISLAFALVLAGVLMSTMSKVGQARDRMAEQRAAARAAEAGALALQAGRAAEGVTVRRVEGEAPAGRAWVEVTAKVGGRSASVVAMVPGDSIKAPAGAGVGHE